MQLEGLCGHWGEGGKQDGVGSFQGLWLRQCCAGVACEGRQGLGCRGLGEGWEEGVSWAQDPVSLPRVQQRGLMAQSGCRGVGGDLRISAGPFIHRSAGDVTGSQPCCSTCRDLWGPGADLVAEQREWREDQCFSITCPKGLPLPPGTALAALANSRAGGSPSTHPETAQQLTPPPSHSVFAFPHFLCQAADS